MKKNWLEKTICSVVILMVFIGFGVLLFRIAQDAQDKRGVHYKGEIVMDTVSAIELALDYRHGGIDLQVWTQEELHLMKVKYDFNGPASLGELYGLSGENRSESTAIAVKAGAMALIASGIVIAGFIWAGGVGN